MKRNNLIFKKLLILSAALSITSVVLASAPVEEINLSSGSSSQSMPSEQATTFAAPSNLSDTQRLARVEQQMNNLNNANLPQQVSQLQEQVQQLTGNLQEQQHALKKLEDQVNTYYQDLDQRLNRLNGNVSSPLPPANPPALPEKTLANSKPLESLPSQPIAPVSKLTEGDEYQVAVKSLMKKNHGKARKEFSAYLSRFPKGVHVASSYYWLGEIHLAGNDLKQAASNFQTVIRDYPKSDKFADAKLKLAIVHSKQGDKALAKQELKRIKSEYPGSTVAQLAAIHIQELGG